MAVVRAGVAPNLPAGHGCSSGEVLPIAVAVAVSTVGRSTLVALRKRGRKRENKVDRLAHEHANFEWEGETMTKK